jgi:hypothetical protein
MPFALDGKEGNVEIEAHGIRHEINFRVDKIAQRPVVDHHKGESKIKKGTRVTIHWPDSARSTLADAKARFLQIVDDFTFLNPHLTLSVDWFAEKKTTMRTARQWHKWLPCYPTSAHWYDAEHLERLIGAYVTHDGENGRCCKLREFVTEFRSLTGSAKAKVVLDHVGMTRANLSDLIIDGNLDNVAITKLLAAMKTQSKSVKPADLGIIGKDHLTLRLQAMGCKPESFTYRLVKSEKDGLPCLIECALGWNPDLDERRLITGINWSPGIGNPFRWLGSAKISFDTLLANQRADEDEPIVLVVHAACPRVGYTDRGKSAVVCT